MDVKYTRMGLTGDSGGTTIRAVKALVLWSLGACLLLAGAVSGTLYASGFWDDDENAVNITPARPKAERFLTPGEAAAKASASVRGAVSETGRSDLSAACKTDSYNANSKDWIVVCTVSGPQNVLEFWYSVDDYSGAVSSIR